MNLTLYSNRKSASERLKNPGNNVARHSTKWSGKLEGSSRCQLQTFSLSQQMPRHRNSLHTAASNLKGSVLRGSPTEVLFERKRCKNITKQNRRVRRNFLGENALDLVACLSRKGRGTWKNTAFWSRRSSWHDPWHGLRNCLRLHDN